MEKTMDAVQQLVSEYKNRGIMYAHRLLLNKADALEFADRLRAIGKGVLGLELWYYREPDREGLIEYIWSPDYSKLVNAPDFITESIEAAENYILNEMPEKIALIGFVF